MKKMVLFVLLLVPSFLTISSSPSFGQEAAPATVIGSYGNCLEKLISRYNAKAELQNSSLHNVQKAAALYWFKARFVEYFKDDLTREMLAEKVGEREYQIEHYVNHRFFEMLRLASANENGIPGQGKKP